MERVDGYGEERDVERQEKKWEGVRRCGEGEEWRDE